MDIQSFAPLVRVYEVLIEKGLLTGITGQETLKLMQGRLEAIVVALEVFCFKKEQLSIEDFVSLITNMYSTADKLGIPLDRFPAYITELKDRIYALRNEIDQIEAKKQDALRDYEMTLELLQEYNANKPFILQMRKLVFFIDVGIVSTADGGSSIHISKNSTNLYEITLALFFMNQNVQKR